MPADRTRTGQLEQPRVHARLVEYVLALARQHSHVVAVLKVHDANRARLAANRLWQRIRIRGRSSSRRSGAWARTRDVRKAVLHLFDPARAYLPICNCRLDRFRLSGKRLVTSSILQLVAGLLPVPVSLEIFRFSFPLRLRLGTARAKLDKRERIEDRACKDATTPGSANISSTSSGAVTLGVTYGTDYLSILSAPAPSNPRNARVPTPEMMTTANSPAMQPVMA